MATIGEMKWLGEFQTNTPTTTATGGKVDSYVTQLTTRGKLRRIRSAKGINGSEVEFTNRYEWQCRFQTMTINKKNRWVIDGTNYAIESYELLDMKTMFYKFILTEVE